MREAQEQAEELRPIDEACPAVVTEKMISDECDEYFDARLPNFMIGVRNSVMAYKHKHLEALKNSGKKRQFIKQCVEDVFATNYNPQNLITGASVELQEEIKKEGYLVSYSIGLLVPKENPVEKWLKGISELCAKEIIGEGTYFLKEIANDYAEEIAKKKNEANGKYAYSYLKFKGEPGWELKKELIKIYDIKETRDADLHWLKTMGWDGNRESLPKFLKSNGYDVDSLSLLYPEVDEIKNKMIGHRLLVKQKEDSDFYYNLNGKDVLHCKISGYADEISFDGRIVSNRYGRYFSITHRRYEVNGLSLRENLTCNCINGDLVKNKCMGSMLVTDEEFEKGFVGVFSWDKPSDKSSTKKKKSAECENPNLTPKEQKKCRAQKR